VENQDVQVQQALWSTVRFAGVSDAVLKKVGANGGFCPFGTSGFTLLKTTKDGIVTYI